MSWSNAGVPARPDTMFDFPNGPVLVHESRIRTIDWNTEGPRRQSDVHRMTGFFWQKPDNRAFGVFTPSLGAGLYHVADPAQMPGMKLWTDGIGRDEGWVSQYTLDGKQCLEIQAGPLIDQSKKDVLAPGQLHQQVEFWIPSERRLAIREISIPKPKVRPVDDIPRFTWARGEEIWEWPQLVAAGRSGDAGRIPKAPDVESNHWAPSGMAELGDALSWAVSVSQTDERDKWSLQQGAWLAGRGDPDAALKVLSQSRDDRARALAGRLWLVHKQNAHAAAASFRSIESSAISLHPQVVIERDKALAALGLETLDERKRWLDTVSALDDDWLAERRASLFLDRGDAHAAMQVLMTTHFQLVHQRYERTRLWRRAASMLGLKPVQNPSWLGEDDLAEFGAYRQDPEVPSNPAGTPHSKDPRDPRT